MIDWKQLAKDSLSVREWKETAKRFTGDPAVAMQYLPIARTILGILANQLKLGGISYGHRIVNLSDGTKIRVIRNGDDNIIEVITKISKETVETIWVRRFGYTFYPRRNDYPSGFIRPITEEEPYGTRARYPWTLIETDGYISKIQLEYQPKVDKPTISVVRCTELLSGNQFEFDGFDVYSWWGSPCGDGPLAVYLTLAEYFFAGNYRPFMFADTVCYLYPGCVMEPIPPICPTFLMRNGRVISDYGTHIVGLKIITYEERDETLKQGIVALYSGGVSCGLFSLDTGGLLNGTVPIVFPTDLADDDPDLSYQFAWPWRFNDDGTEVSGIVRELRKYPSIRTPQSVSLLVVTVKLQFYKGVITPGEPSVRRYDRPEHWERTYTVNAKVGQMRTGGLSYEATRDDAYRILTSTLRVGSEITNGNFLYDNKITTIEKRNGTYEVPFALDYIDNLLVPLIINVEVEYNAEDEKTLQSPRAFVETVTLNNTYIFDDSGNLAGTDYEYHTTASGEETNTLLQTYRKVNKVTYSGSAAGVTLDFEKDSPGSLDFSYYFGIKDTWDGSITGWSVYDSIVAARVGRPTTSFYYSANISSTINRPNEISYIDQTTDNQISLKIPYVKLKASSIIYWRFGDITHDVKSYTATQGSTNYKYGLNTAGDFYLLTPISNGGFPYIPLTPTIESGTETTTTTSSELEFKAYKKKEQEYQDSDSVTESTESFSFGNIYSAWLAGTVASYTRTNSLDYIGADPTNGWVSIYNAVFSVAADYVRPVILEKPPSYMAEISVPNYSKQTSTFGDPADFIEDKPILYPIGLY